MRQRLLLALLLMAFLPAIVIGAIAYSNARQTIEGRLFAELNSVADLKSEEIENWIELVRSDARLIADNFLNEEHITVILDDDSDPELRNAFRVFLTENLLSIQQSRAGYEEVMFIDRSGTVILSTNSANVGKALQSMGMIGSVFTGIDAEHIEDVYKVGDIYEMTFSHVLNRADLESMTTTDERIAALVIRVNLEQSLFNMLENWPDKGATGEMFIVKDEGNQLTYASPLRFLGDALLTRADPSQVSNHIDEAESTTDPHLIESANDYRDVSVLRAYRLIEPTNWIFITKQDQAEIFAPVTELTRNWAIVSIFVLAGASLLSFSLSRNLADPLSRLTKATRQVERGDLGTQVRLDRRDEFGELATSFNNMVTAIRANTETIQRNAEELRALVNVSEGLLSSLGVGSALESALGQALSASSAESGLAMLWDSDEDCLIIHAEMGFGDQVLGLTVPANEEYLPGFAMKQGLVLKSQQPSKDGRFSLPDFIADQQSRALLALPLRIEDRPLALLLLFSEDTGAFDANEQNVLEAIANQVALALERLKLTDDLAESYDRTLLALAAALDARDRETEGHSERVMAYTKAIAERMQLSELQLADLGRGALLHDIGKIGVPDSILQKPASLTGQEWEIMKMHPIWGQQIIEGIPFLEVPTDMVLSHHERWDGTGYPHGLAEHDIPLGARIFSIVDAFDAMTSDRPYREALSFEEAVREIESGSGSQFDPQIAQVFLDFSGEDLETIRQNAAEESERTHKTFSISEFGISHTDQLDALNAVMGVMTSSLDMHELMRNTLDMLVTVTKAAAAGVFLFDAESGRIEHIANFDFPRELVTFVEGQNGTSSYVERSLLSGATLHFRRLASIEAVEGLRLQDIRPDWEAHLVVPLREGSAIFGFLAVFSEAPEYFETRDQSLFERVGLQLGKSILNVRTHEEVRSQALTDGLTGAYNRRFLDDFLDIELKRSLRYENPLTLLMMDMDFFKGCNDRAGHQAGDQVLVDLVQLLKLGLRNVDMVARYGGEEFAVVLPETDLQGALEVAERMRSLSENQECARGSLTASFGVVQAEVDGEEIISAADLIRRADEALMYSKRIGRNRVSQWRPGLTEEPS